MRTLLIALTALLFLAAPVLAQSETEATSSVRQQARLDRLWTLVQAQLAQTLGTSLAVPVQVHLVSGSQLSRQQGSSPWDSTSSVAVKGNPRDGFQVYVLRGWDQDVSGGLLAYGYGRAWVACHGAEGQSEDLREAFAQWLAFQYLESVGASHVALELERYVPTTANIDADLERLFRWQDHEKSPRAVIEVVRTRTEVPDVDTM